MKEKVLKELEFVLDEKTIAFFSVTLSEESGPGVTITSITKDDAGIPDDIRARLSSSLHELADRIRGEANNA